MRATKLQIIERNREAMSRIASLDNFTWVEQEAVNPDDLLTNPNISLYCFDEERRWAVFVVLPDGVNLSKAPFVYHAQHEQAQTLIVMPYMTLFWLAENIELDSSNLTIIHNIGRCGSTLMCQALNAVESVYVLSEPDVFASPIALRQTDYEHRQALLIASFRFLFRPAVTGDATHYVIKLRNQCVDVLDIFAYRFPQANHLFMHRNATDWLASLYRLMSKNYDPSETITRKQAITRQAEYLNCDPNDIAEFFTMKRYTKMAYLAVSWLIMMVRFQEFCDANPQFKPKLLSYEDLTANPRQMLQQVFTQFDLLVDDVDVPLQVFQKDSQAGTRLARDDESSGNRVTLPQSEIETLQKLYTPYKDRIKINTMR